MNYSNDSALVDLINYIRVYDLKLKDPSVLEYINGYLAHYSVSEEDSIPSPEFARLMRKLISNLDFTAN